VQVHSMKPKLKPPETTCLKLKWDIVLSTFAFKFNMRRYTEVLPAQVMQRILAGRCRLTLSHPC